MMGVTQGIGEGEKLNDINGLASGPGARVDPGKAPHPPRGAPPFGEKTGMRAPLKINVVKLAAIYRYRDVNYIRGALP